jgi:hypothetical protein
MVSTNALAKTVREAMTILPLAPTTPQEKRLFVQYNALVHRPLHTGLSVTASVASAYMMQLSCSSTRMVRLSKMPGVPLPVRFIATVRDSTQEQPGSGSG